MDSSGVKCSGVNWSVVQCIGMKCNECGAVECSGVQWNEEECSGEQ